MRRKKDDRAVFSFLLDGVASCAPHPKYMDDEVVEAASITDEYLHFSESLHLFVETVSELDAADPTKVTSVFVEEAWNSNVGNLNMDKEYGRIAATYKDRLMRDIADTASRESRR